MARRPLLRVILAVVVVAAAAALVTSGPGRQPAPHVALRITVGGLQLRVMRAGRGPAVILVHGYGESLMAWRNVFDRLAADADVIAFDLPGFGVSDKPATGYGTDQLGTVVLRLASALGIDSFALVGHSLGGAVAVAAATRAASRVRALVLIAPAGAAAPPLLPDSSDALSATARAIITEYEMQRTRFTPVHDPQWLDEKSPQAEYLPASDPAYRSALSAVLREFDFEYLNPVRARSLRQPTLLLWGAFDQVIPPEQGRALSSAIPRSRLVVLPRTWHRPHVERPAETADTILAFLARLGSPDSP